MNKDPYDLFWDWANKPLDSPLTIDAAIHRAVMMLTPEERKDRAFVNEAVEKQKGPAAVWPPGGCKVIAR